MSDKAINVLLIEDNPGDARLIREMLAEARGVSFDLQQADRLSAGLEHLAEGDIDVVLLDLGLSDSQGLDTFTKVYAQAPEVPIVVLSGLDDEALAIQAVEAGAQDYLVKGQVDSNPLARALRYAIERKRAEETLQASVREWQTTFDAISDAVSLIDLEGRILRCNMAMAEFLDKSFSDIIGRTCWELVHGTSEHIEGCPFVHVRETHGKATLVLQTDDRWLDVAVDPVLDEDGSLSGGIHILTDITERVRAEEALRVSHRFLEITNRHTEMIPLLEEFVVEVKNFTGCAAVGLRMLDEQGNIPYQAYQGFSKGFYESESPLSINVDQCMCINVIKGEADPKLPFYTEGGSFYMNGTTRFLATVSEEEKGQIRNVCNQVGYESVALVPIRMGECILGLIHVADHRENMVPLEIVKALEGTAMQLGTAIQRVQAEEALRESEERFRTIVETAPSLLLITDAKGNNLYVSPNCEEITGYTQEELQGQVVWWVHEDDTPRAKQAYDRTFREGIGCKDLEYKAAKKNGELWYASSSWEPLRDAEGRLQGVVFQTTDITERKQLEQQFLQAQKMEAVGRLTGGIAHDFNNLLTAIIGFSELSLHRHLEEGDPLYRPIEEIRKAGKRAASLTDQLLAFSRKQVLQPRVLDLNAVVAEMDKMLLRVIGEDIDLVTLLDPDLGAVKADPGQLEQVIVNLAVNARDAMPQGGKLTIETKNVELDEAYARRHIAVVPGPHVMLAVSDSGIGMDKETQSHIFEPFFTTKEKGEGTGLGLATVYGIVKQSGGSIWVYSEPGQGTTFKVYLPRVREAVEPLQPSAAPTETPRGSETILVVEDDKGVRTLAHDALEMDGYSVLKARDGEEALRVCEQHEGPIHLMVTDVVMPGMSGRRLAERLEPLRPEMKVLYISGYADNAIVRHGVLEPGLAFLQKPFTPSALARKVRQVLDGPDDSDR